MKCTVGVEITTIDSEIEKVITDSLVFRRSGEITNEQVFDLIPRDGIEIEPILSERDQYLVSIPIGKVVILTDLVEVSFLTDHVNR